MKLLCLLLVAAGLWSVGAVAQTVSRPPPAAANPPNMAGSAGVRTHLEALHYKNVRDLRRGPDGQWVGKATQGNVEKSVTITPQGGVIAR
jgi:hypothetical protein